MEFKGTKGEWKISSSINDDTRICIESEVGNNFIDCWSLSLETENEMIANAKLISASPELLKESMKLIQQIKMSDYVEVNGHNIKNNKALLDLEKAINKALN
tara:strand:- start:5411 stop:5716 length:306 start_codon:yes stop_codon:yes gene_type:complete